jgi:hypothetical protein
MKTNFLSRPEDLLFINLWTEACAHYQRLYVWCQGIHNLQQFNGAK